MNLETDSLGRFLLLVGLLLAALGAVLLLARSVPFVGRLPGDISFRSGGGTFYFPMVTCLIVSVLLSLCLNILMRLLNRT